MIDFACKQFNLDDIVKCALGLTKADYRIMQFFMDHEGHFSAAEVADGLRLDLSTVQRSVKKLHEKDVIMRGQENLSGGGYVFHYSIRSKKYIRKLIMEIIHNWTAKVDESLKKF